MVGTVLAFVDCRPLGTVAELRRIQQPDSLIFWTGDNPAATGLTTSMSGLGQAIDEPRNFRFDDVSHFYGTRKSGGVHVRFKLKATGVATTIAILITTAGDIPLGVDSSGNLTITGVPGNPTSGTASVTDTNEHKVEFWLACDTTNGAHRVVLDNVVVADLTATGVNTGSSDVRGIKFNSSNLVIQDPIHAKPAAGDSAVFSTSDFLMGPGQHARIYTAAVTGNGNYASQFVTIAPNTGEALYEDVDEFPNDLNTTRIRSQADGDKVSFTKAAISALGSNVTKVLAFQSVIGHANQVVAYRLRTFIRTGGTDYPGAGQGGAGETNGSEVIVTLLLRTEMLLSDPATSTLFASMTASAAVAAINGYEIGAEKTGLSFQATISTVSFSMLYIEIEPLVLTPDELELTLAEPAIGSNLQTLATDPLAVTLAVPPIRVVVGEAPEVPNDFVCDTSRQDQYRAMLQKLLPWGIAWPRAARKNLTNLLMALAHELACLHSRALDLIREADPRTTLEMLPDWERALGLPDPCTGPLETVDQRRLAVVTRLTEIGGQSPQYFVQLAASLGFDVEVVEYGPFQVGHSEVGEALTNGQKPFQVGISHVGEALTNNVDWLFTWAIVTGDLTVRDFLVGQGTAGDPLRTWGNDLLECVLERAAPAHTLLLFLYRKVLQPDPAQVSLGLATVTRT